jgi:predicted enzyme related to lactoylglutathione lyase
MGKKIVHVELPAQDVDRAEKFWETVGGWSTEAMSMPGVDYRMYQEGDQGGAVYADDGGPLDYYGGVQSDESVQMPEGAPSG